MRFRLILAIMVAAAIPAHSQVSYWFSQWQKKPDAKTAQEFFMVPGANVTFTYAPTNRVIINASGGAAQTNISYTAITNAPWQWGCGNLTNWCLLATNILGQYIQTNSGVGYSNVFWYSMVGPTLIISNTGPPTIINFINGGNNDTIEYDGGNFMFSAPLEGDGSFLFDVGALYATNTPTGDPVASTNLVNSATNDLNTGIFSHFVHTNGNDYAATFSNRVAIFTNRSMAFYIGTNPPAAPLTHSNVFQVDVSGLAGGKGLMVNTNGNIWVGNNLTAQNSIQAATIYNAASSVGITAAALDLSVQRPIRFSSSSAVNSSPYLTLQGSSVGNMLLFGTNIAEIVTGSWPAISVSSTNRPTFILTSGSRTGHSNQIGCDLLVTNGMVTATNFVTAVPKWVDLNVNYALSVSGPTAPPLTEVTNPASGTVIKQLAFDTNNDELFGQCQLPHNLAITNAAFPAFYTEPHIHFDTIGTLDATHSNVTWRIEWEWADINGGWIRGTNQATMGVTNNFTHYMLELGHITNNPPLKLSAVFRCRLTRPASASQEYDAAPNSHTVILDAFDLHVPVGNRNAIGSSLDNSP